MSANSPPAQAPAGDPFPRRVWPRLALLALAGYVVYACAQLDVSWERVLIGVDNTGGFFARLFPPDFFRGELLVQGLLESLAIAVLASALGVVLALPMGLAAASNLMPPWITWPARALIVMARSFHPVIVALLLVHAVGFGMLAGILALTVTSMGLVGRRFTEAIEATSPKQVAAVRATGSPFLSVLAFGVLPQVLPRFVGVATHQFDSNLRNATIVGLVGAGGIGGTLFAAFQRFDYDFFCAILLSIVGLITLGEALTGAVRAIFVDNATLFSMFRRRDARGRGRPLDDD